MFQWISIDEFLIIKTVPYWFQIPIIKISKSKKWTLDCVSFKMKILRKSWKIKGKNY